jgi:hypothetical protein
MMKMIILRHISPLSDNQKGSMNITMGDSVSHDIFHCVDGKFLAETSGGKLYSRATIDELQNLLHPSPGAATSLKTPNAHWCQAQLLHYGITPSKIEGAAAMRLLEELDQGTLNVPVSVLNIERVLNSTSKCENQYEVDAVILTPES